MLTTNKDNRKDYQTVLEEQTPLVCNDAVENKSSSTRLVTLLGIGIAVFAFLALAGQYGSHNSISRHATIISELKAALADHQSQLQALTVQSTPLLGTALQGSVAAGDACVADNECGSGTCKTKPYAFCADKSPEWSVCNSDQNCASGYCTSHGQNCRTKGKPGWSCTEHKGCLSGSCGGGWPLTCR